MMALCKAICLGLILFISQASGQLGIVTNGNKSGTTIDDSPRCVMYPLESDHANMTVRDNIDKGVHLLRYHIAINGSDADDIVWQVDGENIYKPYKWSRIASVHGKALLSLVFNFDTVSVNMLSFGVEDINITLLEDGCRDNEERVEAIRRLVYNDFNLHDDHAEYREVCNEVVLGVNVTGTRFVDKCYVANEAGEFAGKLVINKWIGVLHGLLSAVRLLILLFAPLLFQSWIYTGDLQSSVPYVVHLQKKHNIEISMKHKSAATEAKLSGIRRMTSEQTPCIQSADTNVPMTKLRDCVTRNPADFCFLTKTMQIVVDHTKLMAQSAVPVNMFTFFKEELIGCGIVNRAWLRSCAAAGCLFGRWFKTHRAALESRKCPPQQPTWGTTFKLLSSIFVAVVLIPLPFHIRVGVYAYTEATEMLNREDAAAKLGFDRPYYEVFWFGVHWYTVVGFLYAIYLVTITIYAFSQFWFYHQFDDIIQDCIYDLREVSYSSISSMLLYHLVAPFKELGFLLGLIFALPYYVVVMPLALCVAIFYGTPTLYMIGRLFYNFRPEALSKPISCLRNNKALCLMENDTKTESADSAKQTFTFTTVYNLDIISPDTRLYPRLPVHRLKNRWDIVIRRQFARFVLPLFISFVTIILMLSITLMYAEALRFFMHMLLLALAGLVLNAKHVMDYFIMIFWTFIYCVQSLKTVHSKYNQMSQKLFAYLKDHLKIKVADATRVPEKFQAFTAFKYFDANRLSAIKEGMRMYMNPEDIDEDLADTEDRLVRNERGNLEWDVHGLVFFVDTQDLPRIPRGLFWKICDGLRAPGCPGPLHQSIAAAFKQLLYMVMFLFIIGVIIMSFHDVFDPTSNNQLLLTLAGGFLPLIIRQIIPSSPTVDLSEYSLKGKIEEILLHYRESWPVYDVDSDGYGADDALNRNDAHSVVEAPLMQTNDDSHYRKEDDIEATETISAEIVEALGASHLSDHARPRITDIPMDAGSVSMDEGSVTVDFDEPGIRLPKYAPRERLLTFATISGPKEDRSVNILEPVIRSVSAV